MRNRIVALVSIASLVLALGATMAMAGGGNNNNNGGGGDGNRKRTFIENDCRNLVEKPRHIDLGCAQNRKHQDDLQLKKIRYRNSQYGDSQVRARGNFHVKGVTDGRTQVRLRFKKLQNCRKNQQAYRRVTVKQKDAIAGQPDRFTEHLGCG